MKLTNKIRVHVFKPENDAVALPMVRGPVSIGKVSIRLQPVSIGKLSWCIGDDDQKEWSVDLNRDEMYVLEEDSDGFFLWHEDFYDFVLPGIGEVKGLNQILNE